MVFDIISDKIVIVFERRAAVKLSLVVPCYNEENNILPFFEECKKAFGGNIMSYEIIFVNDGSRDGTWRKLKEVYSSGDNIKIVNFSRNFGKEAAMYAGLTHSEGEYVTIIDADLQQSPSLVPVMVDFLDKNREYDSVAMFQEKRREGKFISACKKLFYKAANASLKIDFKPGASDFRTFRRDMVNAVLSITETNRFSKGIFSWVGFNTFYMPYTADKRSFGKSSWSFFKLMKYAVNGFVSFSTFPLKISAVVGFLFAFLSLIYIVVVIIEHFFFNVQPPGYATIVFLLLFMGGLQMIMLGVTGEYIAQIFIESKHRPLYIEKDYCSKTDNREDTDK